MRRVLAVVLLAACGGSPRPPAPPPPHPVADHDPDGPHRAAVAAQVQPLIDGEIASSIVVGLLDAGKLEIYGFGRGPGGAPPTGKTLYELGSVTKVYTSLLFADAVQRKEVAVDTPVSELLPPGVTVPTHDKDVITLKHLALHTSGLPRLPPSIAAHAPDPYAGYTEDRLYSDLIQTQLADAPGTKIAYSSFGVGLLGFAIGRKIGPGYKAALAQRVLGPLELTDTTFDPKPGRIAQGTNPDLAPVPRWTFDALAGAGALVSDARDQLKLIQAELDAVAGGKRVLRGAMRFTQEPQLDSTGPNEGLGWQIDDSGRYWHNGSTGGFHAFIGFDPKQRRGVVLLASTASSLIDHLADVMYKVLANEPASAPHLPGKDQLAPFVGTYEMPDMKLTVELTGGHLYLGGPGAPHVRLVPVSDHEFWIEELQTVAVFEKEGDKIKRVVFLLGEHQMAATRVE